MRQITITFRQEEREVVGCTADFGNRDEATDLENKLADASQVSIATVLRKLPAELLAEGCGSTKQQAEQLAKASRALAEPRYGDNFKKAMLVWESGASG